LVSYSRNIIFDCGSIFLFLLIPKIIALDLKKFQFCFDFISNSNQRLLKT
jgi:hypothetical protein